MKRILFLLPLLLLLVIGCETNTKDNNNNTTNLQIDEKHNDYLLNYGWHIKSIVSTESEVIDFLPELMEQFKNINVDLYPYKGREVMTVSYLLEEQQKNNDDVNAVIYEYNDEIIGGYIGLENWVPGMSALDGKERLIEEGIISP